MTNCDKGGIGRFAADICHGNNDFADDTADSYNSPVNFRKIISAPYKRLHFSSFPEFLLGEGVTISPRGFARARNRGFFFCSFNFSPLK